jgi:hypothetical protein
MTPWLSLREVGQERLNGDALVLSEASLDESAPAPPAGSGIGVRGRHVQETTRVNMARRLSSCVARTSPS